MSHGATSKSIVSAISLNTQVISIVLKPYWLLSTEQPLFDKGLQFEQFKLKPKSKTTREVTRGTQWLGFMLALLAHASIIVLLLSNNDIEEVKQVVTPMMVSLIAPPALKPVVKPAPKPIIKPKELVKKVAIKPKRVVENIVPVEKPIEPVLAEAAESVVEESLPKQTVEQTEEKAAAQPVVIEEVIEPPQFGVAYLNNPPPRYPRLSRKTEQEGRVLLKVLVTAEGAALAVSVEKSSGFSRLDEAALVAVKRWRFLPARKGKQSLSAYVLVPINFSLQSNEIKK